MRSPATVSEQVSAAPRVESASPSWQHVLKMVPTLLVPITFWFLPLHLEPKAQHAMAISLFMILGWATEVMDHGLTGLIGCYLFWALNIVTFDVAFSGFASDTPWFL